MSSSSATAPNQQQRQHCESNPDDAQIVLHPPILKPRHQAATVGRTAATGVKSEVDDVLVEEPVDPGEAKHGVREQLQRAIDKPDIQPIARLGPPGVESNEAPFINFIDEIFSAQKRENVGPNAFERINLLR